MGAPGLRPCSGEGDEGARGWPENLWNVLRFFQDFAHEEVRVLRRDLALEACERYQVNLVPSGSSWNVLRVSEVVA